MFFTGFVLIIRQNRVTMILLFVLKIIKCNKQSCVSHDLHPQVFSGPLTRVYSFSDGRPARRDILLKGPDTCLSLVDESKPISHMEACINIG